MIASWIFGAVVLALLAALHGLAYGVGKSRQRARTAGRGASPMSNEPLEPR